MITLLAGMKTTATSRLASVLFIPRGDERSPRRARPSLAELKGHPTVPYAANTQSH